MNVGTCSIVNKFCIASFKRQLFIVNGIVSVKFKCFQLILEMYLGKKANVELCVHGFFSL